PNLCGVVRSDAACAAGAARRGGRLVGERAGRTVFDLAARDHEASRGFVRCRPDRAGEDRAHGRLPAHRAGEGAGAEPSQPLRALLVRQFRSPCRFCGGRPMAVNQAAAARTGERPSLTLTRRLRAKPERVYAAWTQAEQLAQWFGPPNVKPAT